MRKYILLSLIFFIACQQNEVPQDAIDEQLFQLTTDKDKKDYLEEIFKEDQKYRQGQSAQIIQSYGKQSPQFRKFIKANDQTDSINLIKVERFVKRFGYPKQEKLGDLAAQTPWAVIHHARSYEDRIRNFKMLQKAYQNGDIDGGAFSLYLERMYNYKFKERYVIEGVYNEQNQIDSLIRLLELE